jgi:hypothetical protein
LLAYVGFQWNLNQMLMMVTQVDFWLCGILLVQAAVHQGVMN